jgi:hypothetical protein
MDFNKEHYSVIKRGYFQGKIDGIRLEKIRMQSRYSRQMERHMKNLRGLILGGELPESERQVLLNYLEKMDTHIQDLNQAVQLECKSESVGVFYQRLLDIYGQNTTLEFRMEGKEPVLEPYERTCLKNLVSFLVTQEHTKDLIGELILGWGEHSFYLLFKLDKQKMTRDSVVISRISAMLEALEMTNEKELLSDDCRLLMYEYNLD